MVNIVLVEPEIPQNCGNIARTCAATRCRLHLIEPLGFDISEKAVKRAGLDYWPMVDLTVYSCLDEFLSAIRILTSGWPPPRPPEIIPKPVFGTGAGCFSERKPPACPVNCGSGITTAVCVYPCGRTPAV